MRTVCSGLCIDFTEHGRLRTVCIRGRNGAHGLHGRPAAGQRLQGSEPGGRGDRRLWLRLPEIMLCGQGAV